MGRLGRTIYLQGKYGEAEVLLSRCLGIERRALGSEDPDTLSSMSSLADVYWRRASFPRPNVPATIPADSPPSAGEAASRHAEVHECPG